MSDYKISEEISLAGPYLQQLTELMDQTGNVEKKLEGLQRRASEMNFAGAWLRQVGEVVEKIDLIGRAVGKVEGRIKGLTMTPSAVESLAGYGKNFSGLEAIVGKTADAINGRWSSLLSSSNPQERITSLRDHFATLAASATDTANTIQREMGVAFKAVHQEAQTVGGDISGWSRDLAAFERQLSEVRAQMSRPVSNSSGMFGGNSGQTSAVHQRPGYRSGHGSGGGIGVLAMGLTDDHSMAGLHLGHLASRALHSSSDLAAEQTRFRNAGRSEQEVRRATDKSYSAVRQVPTSSVSEAFEMGREIAGETGDAEGAFEVLPKMLKAKAMMEAQTGKSASKQDMLRLFKFVGLRGGAIDEEHHKIDIGAFTNEVDAGVKAIVAGQNLISSNDLLMLAKQGGPMIKGMPPEELFQNTMLLLEDMGGARTGTSMMAMGRQIFGGTMSKKTAKHWKEMGMLNTDRFGDGTGWKEDKEGNVTISEPSQAIKGYDTFSDKGIRAWVEDTVRPIMEGHGIHDRKKQNEELYQFGSTDTGRKLLGTYLSSPEMMEALAERYKKAYGVGGYDANLDGKDPNTAFKAVSKSVETLGAAVADAKGVAPGLMGIAKGVTFLADVMHNQSTFGSVATMGLLGASGGLMAYGATKAASGFGLPHAATELIVAAKMWQANAAREGVARVTPSGVPAVSSNATAAGAAGGAMGLLGKLGQAFGVALVAALAKDVTRSGAELIDEKTGTHLGTNAHSMAFRPLGILGYGLGSGMLGQTAKGLYDSWLGDGPAAAAGPGKPVQHRAAGGFVFGPGGPTSDSVPAWLSSGEYVVSAAAAGRNRDLLEMINSGADLSGAGAGGGGTGRAMRAIDRLADPTDRATLSLMRLYVVLSRIGEAGMGGGFGSGGGGGIHNASLGGSGGFTSGFGGGGGSGGGSGAVGGLADVGGGISGRPFGQRGAGAPNANFTGSNASVLKQAAATLGTTPKDLATVISYETAGKFDPSIKGGKGGNYQGLIQFGPNERAKYGVTGRETFAEQMPKVVAFLKDRGFKPGMGLKDLYSTINAGSPGHYNASDGNGTVASHVARMAREHGGRAEAFLGSGDGAVAGLAGIGATGKAVDNAARLIGAGSSQAASALGSKMTPGEWCADFVNGALKSSGMKGVNSSIANSFLGWGQQVTDGIHKGDVLVQHRGRGIGQTGGHAGLATGQQRMRGGHLQYEMISGNHGNRVASSWVDANRVAARRAVEGLAGSRREVGENEGGFRSTGWRRIQNPDAGRREAPTLPSQGHMTISMPVHLDGRKIADNSARHSFNGMNGPGRGANIPDRGRLYPRAA